jgi:arylsulfatase
MPGKAEKTNKPEVRSDILPPPEGNADVVIGRTYEDSKPGFPQPLKAPEGAPNVLLILLDDVGFGQPSTFGGPVPMPTLDRLAENGLRYNQFHTTALCSPTRGALLSGRNHHSVGFGCITECATGFPGYNGIWPKEAACVAETLRQNGYNTVALGKWHNTPDMETNVSGPFDRWPTGLGFEYFFGFQGGETDQYYPTLYANTIPVRPNKTPEEGYHLTSDMTNKAINYLKLHNSVDPGKPFFMFFAPGAAHAPHQVPKEWIAKFKGQFDQGWDKVRQETLDRQKKLGVVPKNTKLTPRPEQIPAWDSFSKDERRLFARMQEVFAAFLANADHEVGRLVDAIEELGELDNTLIFYIAGDNGASAEGTLTGTLNEMRILNGVPEDPKGNLAAIDEIGGPKHHNHYPVGWAWAGDAPLQWTKQVASHFGGTRNGMVIHWPQRIKDNGGLRSQFHHCIDVVPTILEAAGIPQPRMVNGVPQKPIEGVSMAYSFDDAKVPSTRTTQYFEMFANRALYHNGWVAACFHGRVPWETGHAVGFDQETWELYNIEEDFSQSVDLAAKEPEKLRELQDLWWTEAGKYNVLPLDDRMAERAAASMRPDPMHGRTEISYGESAVMILEPSSPSIMNKSYSITADVEIPPKGAEGMLVTCGGSVAGYAFYVENRKLVWHYNYFGEEHFRVESSEDVPSGHAILKYEFKSAGGPPGSGGTGTLSINGKKVGELKQPKTVPFRFSTATFNVGEINGSPVVPGQQGPFRFTGKINAITFNLQPRGVSEKEKAQDKEAQFQAALKAA